MSPHDANKLLPDSHPAKAGADQTAGGTATSPAAWSGTDAGTVVPPALSSAPTMNTMVQAVRRHWLVLFGLGLLGAGLAFAAVWFLVPPKYTAEVLLEFERPARAEGDFDVVNFKKVQAARLKGYNVFMATLKKAEVAELSEVRAHADPKDWLQSDLLADEKVAPGVLRVVLGGDHPDELPVIVNEVVRAYLREFAADEQGKMAVRIKLLRDTYKSCVESLRDKRQKLRTRKEALGLDDPETMQVRYQTALGQLAAAQTPAVPLQLELKKAEVELATILARLKAPETIPISEFAIDEELKLDPVIKKHFEDLAVNAVKIQEIKSKISPRAQGPLLHGPLAEQKSILATLTALRDEMRTDIEARLRGKLVFELKEQAAKLRSTIELTREQRKSLDGEVKRLRAEVESLRFAMIAPDKLPPDLLALKDDVDQTEMALKKLGEELGTLQVGSFDPKNLPADFRTVQVGPISPRVTMHEAPRDLITMDLKRQVKMAGGAGLGMFALVFFGVVLFESRQRRVYGATDVVQGLGINLLGTLPALPAHTRRPLAALSAPRDLYWQNIMTESVDVIRTVLLHSAQVESLRVVMVTSAIGGEGKTSLASHLAASLARSWRKTLLIDCDLRNPAAHQQFDVPLEPGFSEVLRGEVEFGDVIRPTPVSRLWMIPAGKWDSHAIQALAQDGVRSLFDRLKEQYDFIIIDACPVLPVADSLLIGQHADAVLFSILRDVSRMSAVYAAHQRLSALGIRMLGAVVIGEKVDSYGRSSQYLTQSPS
jgi:capsular exopolysaccharide synthesis family protein